MLRAAARQLEHRVSEAAAQCCAPAARAGLAAAWAGRSSSDPAKSCRSAWARCVSNSAAVACVAGGKGAAEAAAAQHSEKQSKLFRKVLDGEFKPPEDTGKPAGAAGKAPSAAGRVASFIGNTLFYGTLLGGAAFVGSTYAVTDEEVKRRRDAADAARGEGPLAEAAAVATGYFAEAREWYAEKVKGFTEPGSDALLPDLLPFQRANRMRTLVLDLDGVLVQSVWQRKHGWKTVKRPGAEAFLDTMAQYFELVVFTSRSHSYADPILNRVDPGIQSNQGPVLMYRLYKNSTQWRHNEAMRDLSKLNRDLSNVIFLVTESKKATVEPSENCIVIPDYAPPAAGADVGSGHGGARHDTVLLDIVPLLELIWKQDVPDTRAVCRSYEGKDVVEEFRRRDRAKQDPRTQAPPKSRLGRFGFSFG